MKTMEFIDEYELERMFTPYLKSFYLLSKKLKEENGKLFMHDDVEFIGKSVYEARLNLTLRGFSLGKLICVERGSKTHQIMKYKFTLDKSKNVNKQDNL